MTYDNSEESDSDYEELSVPQYPPEKPPGIVNYYVEQNKNGPNTENELRLQWKEGLGQIERQKWKKKHKKLQKRYEALLQLYVDHHPEFDYEAYQQQQRAYSSPQRSSSSNRNRKKTTSGNSRGRRTDNYEFFDGANDDYNGSPNRKKRKRNNKSSKSQRDSVDELFRGMNQTKRAVRNAAKFEPSDDQKIQMKQLVEAMRNAAKKDWQCNRNKKPAINTLKMLDVVVSELSKRLFYKHYLDDTDILEAIRDWIHPLPDGSLPARKIRTEMYRIIEKFALHEYDGGIKDYLGWSEQKSKDDAYRIDLHPNLKSFAKTCMNLWAHKKESTSNKALLRKIMEKWIRALTGSDRTYGDLRDEMRENKELIKKRYKVLQRQQRDFRSGGKRAQIPEKAWHDFAIAPT
eukprot:290746_1